MCTVFKPCEEKWYSTVRVKPINELLEMLLLVLNFCLQVISHLTFRPFRCPEQPLCIFLIHQRFLGDAP